MGRDPYFRHLYRARIDGGDVQLLTPEDADHDVHFSPSGANHLLADKLEGKLLLMYGTLDDNIHPNANLLLIDELIRHNEDFDLVVLPNWNHGLANEPYVIRRTWDYFVRHLQGREPPHGVEISGPPDR